MTQIYEHFKNPNADTKPMLRWWFPDAGADLERVKHQIQSMIHSGFGGVEVAMVPQYVDMDPKEYGWGSEHWKNIMKTILKEAPKDFKVDFTITAHWPPALNTIDPNKESAAQELAFTITKVNPNQKIEIPMPKKKILDEDGLHKSKFIFTDTLIAVSIGKVKSINDNQVILYKDSLQDITNQVSLKRDKETGELIYKKAGIPEEEKSYGSRKKLADRQYFWEIDLTGTPIDTYSSANKDLMYEDWIMFSYFMRGTGETISGRDLGIFELEMPMEGKVFAIDYFSKQGTDAILNWWNYHFLNDSTLHKLLLERSGNGAIFEDSIETFSDYPLWTTQLLAQFKERNHFSLVPYLPFIISEKGSEYRYETENKIQSDIYKNYEQLLNTLYIENHVKRISEWTKFFGYEYRAQSYGGCIDTAKASTVLDIAEGESLGFGNIQNDFDADKFRDICGGVHLRNKKFLSEEALAAMEQSYALTWKSALSTLDRGFVSGVNRVILHGASYEKNQSGKTSMWPGWHAFGALFAEPWDERQIYWSDVIQFTNYIAKTQAVLQNGLPQVDLAIFKKDWMPGRGFSELLDIGYSYDFIGSDHLKLENMVVENKHLSPNTANYKGLILNNISALNIEDIEIFIEFAKAGLPIIFYKILPESNFGYDKKEINIKECVIDLLDYPTVKFAQDIDSFLQVLKELGIFPDIKYKESRLRAIQRIDYNGTKYFFIHNWNEVEIRSNICIYAEGNPYVLNPWDGNIYKMKKYKKQEKNILVPIHLQANESIIICITNELISEQEEAADIDQMKNESIELNIWNLRIESWGPGKKENPTESEKKNIRWENCSLGKWEDLNVTESSLEMLGVKSMSEVSGIGYYSTSFQLSKVNEAYLKLEHGSDMITEIVVNGIKTEGINHSRDYYYLGNSLVKGENHIRIKLVSTLNNRVKIENIYFSSEYALQTGGPPPDEVNLLEDESFIPPLEPQNVRNQFYGILKATLFM